MALPPIEIDVRADTSQAEASLKRIGDSAAVAGQRVQGGAVQMTASTAQASQGFSFLGGQSRMLTQQLSQVGQQFTATGNLGQALAVQAADIGLAFGTIGTIAGTLIGITLPSLISMFSRTGEEAGELADRVEEATQRIKDLSLEARQLRLGVTPEELALMDKLAQATDAVREIQERIANGERLRGNTLNEILRSRIAERDAIAAQLEELRDVQTEVERLREGSGSLLDNFTALIPIAERFAMITGQAAENVLAAARNAAVEQATLGERGRGRAGPGGPLIGSVDAALAAMGGEFITFDRGQGGAGGGGVAGPASTLTTDLEALQEQLMTETEAAQSAYEQRLELLRQARENQLLTNQEYDELEQRLAGEHAQKLLDIDVWRHGNSLDQTQAFFGQAASAMMSGNEKMVEIGRKFAAIEATINAGRAFAQVAADPSLPWFAKIPAAIGVAAAISQFANQSGIGGRGAGGAAVSQIEEPQAQTPTQSRSLTLVGDNFNRQQAIQIAEFMNEGTDNGLVIRGRR